MPDNGKRTFRLIGSDWDKTTAFAKAHEHDRLWSVKYTDRHPLAHLSTMLYRTLDEAIKAAFGMAGNTITNVWFRREHDIEHFIDPNKRLAPSYEPLLAMRGNDGHGIGEVLAYIEPVYLAFSLPEPKPSMAPVLPPGMQAILDGKETAQPAKEAGFLDRSTSLKAVLG